jgi:hypothetical protein
MKYKHLFLTIEGVLPRLPKRLRYTPYILPNKGNAIVNYMGKWYFI